MIALVSARRAHRSDSFMSARSGISCIPRLVEICILYPVVGYLAGQSSKIEMVVANVQLGSIWHRYGYLIHLPL